jgi:hypothetical protein
MRKVLIGAVFVFLFTLCFGQANTVWAADPVPGCTDPSAINYDPWAYPDDHSCNFCPIGQFYNRSTLLCETPIPGAVLGCTDPSAGNYNPLATQDDYSCTVCPVGQFHLHGTDACETPLPPNVPEFGLVQGVITFLTSGGAFFFLKKHSH